MILNEEKRAKLVEVLALREEAATGAGAPALSASNIAPAAPSPAPSTPLMSCLWLPLGLLLLQPPL